MKKIKFVHTKQFKNIKRLWYSCQEILNFPNKFKDFDLSEVRTTMNQLNKAMFCCNCHGIINSRDKETDQERKRRIALTTPCHTRICYPCSSHDASKHRIKLSHVLNDVDLQQKDCHFITLTMPNVPYNQFNSKKVGELNRLLFKRFQWYLKLYIKDFPRNENGEIFILQDYVKKIEIPFSVGKNGFNYHTHLLVVSPKKTLFYDSFKDIWNKTYNSILKSKQRAYNKKLKQKNPEKYKKMKKEGKIKKVEINCNVDFKWVKNPNEMKAELSKYINKDLVFNVDINDYKEDLKKQLQEAIKHLEIVKNEDDRLIKKNKKRWEKREEREKEIKNTEGLIEKLKGDIEWCNTHTQKEFNLWWIKLLCAIYNKQLIQFNGIFHVVQEVMEIQEAWESGEIHKVNKLNDLMEEILDTNDPYEFLAHLIIEGAIHHWEHRERIDESKKPFIYFLPISQSIKTINKMIDEPLDLRIIPELLKSKCDEETKDKVFWFWNKYTSLL